MPPRVWLMCLGTLAVVLLLVPPRALAWDEEGHNLVVEAAVARLPAEMPEFVRHANAVARLRYLGSEPDRWRNTKLPPMSQFNNPDHYFDVDLLPRFQLSPERLPKDRYAYVAHLAAHDPDKAAPTPDDQDNDQADDPDPWKDWPGFAPYRICELYVQLKSSWRTYNTYSKYRDQAAPGELDACRDNIVYLMGVLSHYVADVAQPLHTTKHYDGWVGPNPEGYVTRRGYLHRLMDGGVIRAARLTPMSIGANLAIDVTVLTIDDQHLFEQVVAYVVESHQTFERVYSLEKEGALTAGNPNFDEGAQFVNDRLARASIMLAALWEAAYRDAGIDDYREGVFRKKGES